MTIVVALGTGAFLVTRSAPAARPALQSTKVFPVVSVPNAIAVVTPEPPASARFEFQSKASGHEASFYVLGWVTNTSPFAIDRPKVVAVLVDAAGKEVGTRQGFSSANDLGPGEKSAIKVLITDPPEYAELRYEVVARKASYRTPRAASLRVEPVKPARASFGNAWDVSGKVFNDGTEPAKFVRVTVLAYDGQGGLIGVNETYADRATEGLAPGAAARFTAPHSFPGITPARFEFQVDGATAKP